MSFVIVAFIGTIAALLLGLGFLFAGDFMLGQWGLSGSDAARLMGRRIGAVYLGLAILLFLGRDAPPSDLRAAVCAGLGVAVGLLACLGLFELRARRASAGILVSVVVEIALASAFGSAWRA